MPVIPTTVLYAGDNIQLVNTMLNLSDIASAKASYSVVHLSNTDDLPAALAEKNYSHFICQLAISEDLAEQIAIDFPLIETIYLIPPEGPEATELSAAMKGLVSDEIKETLDYLSLPVYFKDKDGRFLACNSYFSHLFGLTPAQVIGKTAAEVLPAELRDEIAKIDQKVFVDQQVYFYECSISDFAGRTRDVVFRKESVSHGKIQIGMIFDVTEINEAKSLLEKERVMLRTTADISSDLICFKDLESRYLGCNQAFEQFVGYSEQEIVGKTDAQLFPREQALISQAQDREVITSKLPYIGDGIRVYHDGKDHLVEVKKVPLLDKQGDAQGLIAVGRDITTYRRMQKRLKIADTVFENSKENLLVSNEKGIIIAANKTCCATTGFSKEELIGSHISVLATNQRDNIEAALQTNTSWHGDITYRFKNGTTHFSWLEIYVVEHTEKGVFNRIYSFTDLNQSKILDKKIQFLAKHDPLTGLFNRIALFTRLEDAISRAQHNESSMAVLLVDINGFKRVNELHGHHIGDAALKAIAQRFKSCVFGKDTVARFGDDEFVLIVDELSNEQDVAIVAQKIAAQFEHNFEIDDLSVHLSATIGIALCPDDGNDVDTLLNSAEKAMQRGKSYYKRTQRSNTQTAQALEIKGSKQSVNSCAYHFYSKRLTQHSRQQVKFEDELKQALAEEQFELYYQPQYDLNKRQVIAVEAVLCWNHPQRGPLHSDNFTSIAEHSGLAVSIGLMMIRKAALQAVTWQKAEINFGRIAISLTEVQLSQLSLIADLQTILLETKCLRECLEFAVEEMTLKNYNPVIYENLVNLSKMGIALTIDKFGEERPLFRLFEHLTIDKFKLSQHVSEGVYVDFVNRAIQDGVFLMARSLGLTVVSDSLGNNTGGVPAVADKFSPVGQDLQSKAMKASEVTFYLRCNKRK